MNRRLCLCALVAGLVFTVAIAVAEPPSSIATSGMQFNEQQIVSEVIPQAPRGGRVVAHYCAKNTGYVGALKSALKDIGGYGWRIDRLEVFRTKSSDVRWYHRQDRRYAVALAGYIAANIRSSGYRRGIKRNSKVNYRGRKPRSGTIELFLCNR